MFTTHGGGRAKRFEWAFEDDAVTITNENGKAHHYSLGEMQAVLDWLTTRFGKDWFRLANNVKKLGRGEEVDGLGIAILHQRPNDIRHAQGSSYLGVVLEKAGILEWNGRQHGIQWRIIRQIATAEELRETLRAAGC